MNDCNLVRNKREAFRVEIRKNQLDKIFNQKRRLSTDDPKISLYYGQLYQQFGKIKLLDLLYQINKEINQPIIEMVQNDLANQLCKFLTIQDIEKDWELFKQILTYFLTFVRIPDEYLQPYLRCYGILHNIGAFFVVISNEIFRKQYTIKGNDTNFPLEEAFDDQSKLSYIFIRLDQIIQYCIRTIESRKELLKNKLFVHAICHSFNNPMDNEVMKLHLQVISSLLHELYKQDNDCKKYAQIFIYPVCHALETQNNNKLGYLLQILYNLTLVGMHNGYINQIFKFNGAINLIQVLNDGQNDCLVLRIIFEIIQQSPAHIEIFFKDGLLLSIKNKLIKNNPEAQYFALWIIENCLIGSKAFYDQVYQNHDITNIIIGMLQNNQESPVQEQVCFTLCAYLQKGNPQQILNICQSRIHIQLFKFLELKHPELTKYILQAIIQILNNEAWQSGYGNSQIISTTEKHELKQFLENQINNSQIFHGELLNIVEQLLLLL